MRRYGGLIWVLAALFLMYGGVAALAFTMPLFFVAACLQLPFGMAMDRVGVKRVLLFAALLMAFGGVVVAFSYDRFSLEVGRLLMGVGGAAGVLGLVIATTRYLPARHIATFIGLGSALALVCRELGDLYTTQAVTLWGWRAVIFGLALIGAALSIFLYQLKEPVRIHPKSTLPLVAKKGRNWLIALAFLTFFPVFDLLPALLGLIVGGPIVGAISDYFQKRKPVILFCQLAAFSTFILNIYFPSFWLNFLMGAAYSGHLLFYPFVCESNPKEAQATSVGFVASIAFLGAAFTGLFAVVNAFPALLVVSLIATVILEEPKKKKERTQNVMDRLVEKVEEIQRYKKAG